MKQENAREPDQAARLYRITLEQQPDMPEALLNLGGSSACWTRALEAEPALAERYFGPAID